VVDDDQTRTFAVVDDTAGTGVILVLVFAQFPFGVEFVEFVLGIDFRRQGASPCLRDGLLRKPGNDARTVGVRGEFPKFSITENGRSRERVTALRNGPDDFVTERGHEPTELRKRRLVFRLTD
jgi:hypothetical protein